MSKKTKSASKEKRKKLKASRKAAQKALYAAYTEAGKTKSKRRRIASKKAVRPVRLFDHPNGACGNVGCRKCNTASLRYTRSGAPMRQP